jgi:hypothetical protein
LEYRDDFEVAEEVLKYTLSNSAGGMDVSLRFRENHISRYQLSSAGAPQLTENPAESSIDAAKAALKRYLSYSGDAYLTEMRSLLDAVNQAGNGVTSYTNGNLKLQVTVQGSSAEFLWMYTQDGLDFSAKSLRMTFENRVLTALTDGYFLFTVADTDINFSQSQAEAIAQGHVEAMSWNINGTTVSGFKVSSVASAQMIPHPRGNSVALVPYWYVMVNLDKTYSGGINMAAVGVWADTGKVADVQMLSG